MSNISQSLDFRQSQQLVMTPQLQQAIKLLQMSNVEITEFVEDELGKNPLLEKSEGDGDGSSSEEAAETPESSQSDNVQDEFDQAWTGNESDKQDVASDSSAADFDASSMSMAGAGSGGQSSFENPETSFENMLSKPETLQDHLLAQLHLKTEDPRDRMIGALLIDQLDAAGYLRVGIEELAKRLSCSEDRVYSLLKLMRGFDPTGVFAEDLPDCLALQLAEDGELDSPMLKLLDHLDLLASKDFEKLAEVCGVNTTYLMDMVDLIKSLNPKPAAEFDHLVVQTVVPDVLMKPLPREVGGGWKVELNNETLPKVLVNQAYYAEVAGVATKGEDKKYITDQLNSANWLVKALDQRANTILKVASEIVEEQNGFFLYGIEYLQPLTLKDIAEKVEMHESTISRVTANKYIGTPRGIFELKYFFTTALVGSDGQAHSAESIRAKIKKMVDDEDPKKILSDDKIVALLNEGGVEIARRTVAKYREALGIGSSVQRRKEKKGL